MKWPNVIWYEIKLYMKWHDMIWHNIKLYDMTWKGYDMKWNDMKLNMIRSAIQWYDMLMLMIMVPLPIVTQGDSHLDTGVLPANERFRWPVFSAHWVGKWLVVKSMLLSCWFSLFKQTAHRICPHIWSYYEFRQFQKMWHCSCRKGTLALPNYDGTLCLRSTSCLR